MNDQEMASKVLEMAQLLMRLNSKTFGYPRLIRQDRFVSYGHLCLAHRLIFTLKIFYVNPVTGERSRDLPLEMGGARNESDMTDLVTDSSRAVRRPKQLQGRADDFQGPSQVNSQHAGFGLSKRSGTPEPWTKRLADDGLTYYYFNKITGQIQWTRPTIDQAPAANTPIPVPRIDTSNATVHPNDNQNGRKFATGPSSTTSGYASTDTMLTEARLRADSVTSHNQGSTRRESVYSDDSDIQPKDAEGAIRPPRGLNATPGPDADPGQTPAERSAMLLQEALAPPVPETIDTLADMTRDAIIVVMAAVDDNGLPKGVDHDKEVEQNVTSVVVAVRNLLYVSCALSGPLPNVHGERDAGDPSATAVAQQLQAQLKTSQRKVTATLSKLVLSARAARYRRETFSSEMMIRIEQDAADLQRAVDNFVSEAKKQYSRTVIKQLHQRVGRKRLRGVFDLKHIGPGLPGAGVGGSWKGFGFINVDEGLGLPRRTLNEETIGEARRLQLAFDDGLGTLVDLLQDSNTAEGVSRC
jgi:son of sevenless